MPIVPKVRRGRAGSRGINTALGDLAAIPSYTVAGVPSAAENEGYLIHVSDGAAGGPCLAYSNGTAWLRVLLGVAVAT